MVWKSIAVVICPDRAAGIKKRNNAVIERTKGGDNATPVTPVVLLRNYVLQKKLTILRSIKELDIKYRKGHQTDGEIDGRSAFLSFEPEIIIVLPWIKMKRIKFKFSN
ncbi:hypothetical protein J6590_047067 [Homalodisca vitripennis]|nr:hypothetical protein J6590_047067 [Homalodisca vitripennis]